MIKINKVKVLNNSILVTLNRYSIEDSKEFIDEKAGTNAIKEYQEVLEVGPLVRDIKVGDVVMINPKAYEVRKYKDGSLKNDMINQEEVVGYNFNIIPTTEGQRLLITDRDVEYIIEDYND